jgi:hypothetical protein
MGTGRSFNKQKARSRAHAPVRAICEPAVGLESVTRSYYYGELEAGAEDAADAVAAASEAAEEAAEAESAADEAAAAAESAAAGAVVSVLAQPASASAARRALRASFVFIELYPEIEKGKR